MYLNHCFFLVRYIVSTPEWKRATPEIHSIMMTRKSLQGTSQRRKYSFNLIFQYLKLNTVMRVDDYDYDIL